MSTATMPLRSRLPGEFWISGRTAVTPQVYLANRFPDAEITCVEPPGANFEALRVNTAPYREHKVPCRRGVAGAHDPSLVRACLGRLG